MKILPPLEDEDTMIAALGYPFWYLASWMVFLSRKKEEPFVKFHTLQSLYFGLSMLGAELLVTLIVFGIFRCVPSARGMIDEGYVWKGYMWKGVVFVIIFILFCLALFLAVCITLYFAYKAYKGQYFKLPFIGQYIENRYFSYLMDETESEQVYRTERHL